MVGYLSIGVGNYGVDFKFWIVNLNWFLYLLFELNIIFIWLGLIS